MRAISDFAQLIMPATGGFPRLITKATRPYS